MSRADILADPEHFRARVMQDALTEATAEHWERRADALNAAAAAAADPDAQHGNAGIEERRERWQRCADAALACRRHASLIRNYGLDKQAVAEIVAMLEEADAT